MLIAALVKAELLDKQGRDFGIRDWQEHRERVAIFNDICEVQRINALKRWKGRTNQTKASGNNAVGIPSGSAKRECHRHTIGIPSANPVAKIDRWKGMSRNGMAQHIYLVYRKRAITMSLRRETENNIEKFLESGREGDELWHKTRSFAESPLARSEACWPPLQFFSEGHFDDDPKGWERVLEVSSL